MAKHFVQNISDHNSITNFPNQRSIENYGEGEVDDALWMGVEGAGAGDGDGDSSKAVSRVFLNLDRISHLLVL